MRWSVLASIVLLSLPLAGHANPQPVKVVSISNGQQLLIEYDGEGRALRLACLQAPRQRQQPWANQAKFALQSLVSPGQSAMFELRARDIYGRLVGRLLVDGEDIGAELVSQGRVFFWNGFVGRCDDLDYNVRSARAEQDRLGIWSVQGGLQRPWDLMESSQDGAP